MKYLALIIFLSLACTKKDSPENQVFDIKHQHGKASLNMTFEDLKGEATLVIGGYDLYGFEHQAKNAEDKKKQEQALKFLSDYFRKMISFNQIPCQYETQKVELREGNNHSEVQATYNITCEKNIEESYLILTLGQFYKDLAQLDLSIKTSKIHFQTEAIKGLGTFQIK